MSGDFYKEWREKAEVDYFPQLVVWWLCWYTLASNTASQIFGHAVKELKNIRFKRD